MRFFVHLPPKLRVCIWNLLVKQIHKFSVQECKITNEYYNNNYTIYNIYNM